MPRGYIPERGDLVWLRFSPQSGHEQAGHRPAFVLSPSTYNRKVGLALFCPITGKVKGYPFEVPINEAEAGIQGAILSDQIKSLDWKTRKAKLIGRASQPVIEEVRARLLTLI